jgi:hypothetical protein
MKDYTSQTRKLMVNYLLKGNNYGFYESFRKHLAAPFTQEAGFFDPRLHRTISFLSTPDLAEADSPPRLLIRDRRKTKWQN